MLYDRDYRKLTEEEVSVWKKVEELFNKSKRGGIISPAALHKYWDDLPCAVVHYKQLFPNNYIIPSQLRQKNGDTSAVEKFKCLLNGNCTERSVLNFIKEVWGIERSGFFNGREKWAKGFENQRV